jgi:hypothetical protein
MTDPVDVPDPLDPAVRIAPAPSPDPVPDQPIGARAPAGAREVAAALCPYLASAGGSWRMATPSREHRCIALSPPAAQTTDKQRRHCLSAEHVDCSIYRAARESRRATLAGGADPRRIAAADDARRPLPRTAPILLEPPRLVDQVTRLQLDRAPGQLALVALMVVAFAVVALSRLTSGSSPGPSLDPSPSALGPSRPAPTSTPVPTVAPSADASASASSSASPSFRTTYTVKKGDTLVGVASKFQTTAEAIRTLNNLTTSTLHVGQVLKIP